MESAQQQALVIDGSMLEGGGQLFRISLALSYLLNKSIFIKNIRKNRPKGGGLANQHLTCANTLFGMMNSLAPNYTLIGHSIKSTELQVLSNIDAPSRLDESFIQMTGGVVKID